MSTPRHHKLWYQSSYDRGLDILLELWPRIKEKFPDATLDIAYGWQLFDRATVNNKERQQWKLKVSEMMKQDGITHHGRIGKEELKKLRKQCGILAYPTYFTEIFMIGAVEAQSDGLVPVAPRYAALPETVKGGILVEGSIYSTDVQNMWLEALFEVMESDEKWETYSKRGIKFAKDFEWSNIAQKWVNEFESEDDQDILVSIVTPTLREGFWNIMANNIAAQTYRNIEWVIVDDYETSRKHIAEKYARLYNLNIKYLRGEKKKSKHPYALARANNIALENVSGQLMVFLQDFVIIPQTGIEELVREHKRHPNDLIAPVDVYYSMKSVNRKNKEDWFDGETNVFGGFIRKNQRIQGNSISLSDNATDWEANYGAIPTHIAKKVGGWWEFYDEALGWDNTDIAWRAMSKGSKLFVDETNVAVCLDHWQELGKDEGGKSVNRARRLNDPRFYWMIHMVEQKRLDLIRDPKLEKLIDLSYEIPEDISDEDCVEWMRENLEQIIGVWEEVLPWEKNEGN